MVQHQPVQAGQPLDAIQRYRVHRQLGEYPGALSGVLRGSQGGAERRVQAGVVDRRVTVAEGGLRENLQAVALTVRLRRMLTQRIEHQ